MKHFGDLPASVQLPMPFAAHLYPTAEGGQGVTVRGHGRITLAFEDDTGGVEDVAVRVEDIEAVLHPCRIPFDVDGDGMAECLDIPGLVLGPETFDLKATKGRFNPRTRAFKLTFVISLTGGKLGAVVSDLLGDETRFEIEEHGILDLEAGKIDTRSSPFSLESGRLKGLTVVNCSEGVISSTPCYATLSFGVVVNNGTWPATGAAAGAPKLIWIAPNTPVKLLWQATGAPKVDIQPEVGERPATGTQAFPDLSKGLRALDRAARYDATTIAGECVAATGKVDVRIAVAGQVLRQTAPYNDPYHFWNAVLPPHTYDPNIHVSEIMLDSNHADAVKHLRWRLDFIPAAGGLPVGTIIPGHDAWIKLAATQALPGEYRFTPQLNGSAYPEKDRGRTIYFRLKVALP